MEDTRYRVTIEYVAIDGVEHTIQAYFSNLGLGLSKTKYTCTKDDVKRVKKIEVEEC